jgi:hypothetical protein
MVKILHRIFVLLLIPCMSLDSVYAELHLINSSHSSMNSLPWFDTEAIIEPLIESPETFAPHMRINQLRDEGTRRGFIAAIGAGLAGFSTSRLGAQESGSLEARFLRVAGTVLTNIRDKKFGRLSQVDRDQLSKRLNGIIQERHFQIDPTARYAAHWDETLGIVLNPRKLANVTDEDFESIIAHECHRAIDVQRQRSMDGESSSRRFFSKMNEEEIALPNFAGRQLQEDYKTAIALAVIGEFEAKRFELSYMVGRSVLSHPENVVFDEDRYIRQMLSSYMARGDANAQILWQIGSVQDPAHFRGRDRWHDADVLLDWSMTWVKILGRYRSEAASESKPQNLPKTNNTKQTAEILHPGHRAIIAVPIVRAAA